MLTIIYSFFLVLVIGLHFFFAFGQWFRWSRLCEKLTDLTSEEAVKTEFLGRSIASYNVAIGIGLLLSLIYSARTSEPELIFTVQASVLVLIAVTALVGAAGTKGNSILFLRFIPAILALTALAALMAG